MISQDLSNIINNIPIFTPTRLRESASKVFWNKAELIVGDKNEGEFFFVGRKMPLTAQEIVDGN